MKTEVVTKQYDIGTGHANSVFQWKYFYPNHLCYERIGNKKAGQYNKQPGTFITKNSFNHILKIAEEKIPNLYGKQT